MRVVAVIFGIILLLPGACSFLFMLGFLPAMFSGHFSGAAPLILLWLVCFAVSYGGLMMIRSAGKS
jgi:hypothetical protein